MVKLKKLIRQHWQIILIFSVGAILRFWNLEKLTTFSGDQGYDFLIIFRMLTNHDLTLLGPKIGPYNEIGNLYLGPIYYYLLAPALLLFNFDPIGAAILTVIFAILTVFLIYKFCLDFLTKEVGIVASALYAFNTFLIDQSRAPSNPHFLPFFSIGFLYSLKKTLQSNSKKVVWSVISGICLGTMFQLHYLSTVMSLFSALLLFKNRFRQFFVVVLSFLFAISPQIIFEVRNEFFVTNLFLKQVSVGDNISHAALFFKNIFDSIQKLQTIFLNSSNLTLLIIFFFSLIVFAYFLKEKEKRIVISLLYLTIVLGIFSAALYSGGIEPHYFATIYPQIVIIMAVIIVSLFYKWNNFLPKAVVALVSIQLITVSLERLNLNAQQGYTMPPGWNLVGAKKAAKIVASDVLDTKTFNIASTLDGDTRARPARYLVEIYGKTPLDVEKYPEADILYLISRDEEEKIKEYTVWEVWVFAPFDIKNKWEIQNGINLYKIEKKTNEI